MNAANILPTLTDKQIRRFWSKVDIRTENECWIWKGSLRPTGYGRVTFGSALSGGKSYGAHRAAYFLTNGAIPAGKLACHKCDVPLCCNPKHLWLGSPAENMADRGMKGRTAQGDRSGSRLHPERMARGESNGWAILNSAQVKAIRKEYSAGGISQRKLAKKYSVVQGTLGFILRRETWKHVA